MLKRRSVLVGLTGACFSGTLTTAATSQSVRFEAGLHPSIAKAIEGLEDITWRRRRMTSGVIRSKPSPIDEPPTHNSAWLSLTPPKWIANKQKAFPDVRAAGRAGIFPAASEMGW